jgi:hypothetical protein
VIRRLQCQKPKKIKTKKGEKYKCGVCGLVVKVDEVYGCVDVCDIVCCERSMKKKRKTK